ncbi:hypothetical protein GUU_04139 [Malacoplasma iowae 695]|nr:hypothetical protein GUU_04139 [Malacoplasma iowae 695]
MDLSNVDFPQPFGPIIEINSPLSISMLKFSIILFFYHTLN